MTPSAQSPSATSLIKVHGGGASAQFVTSFSFSSSHGCPSFPPGSISTIICDVPQKALTILECVSGQGKTVKTIVLMEAFDAELVSRGQECGVEIISLADFEVRQQHFSRVAVRRSSPFTYVQI